MKLSSTTGTSTSTAPTTTTLPKNNAASAKELPVWIVSIFLLLHLEEHVYSRNTSGDDERRFESSVVAGFTTTTTTTTTTHRGSSTTTSTIPLSTPSSIYGGTTHLHSLPSSPSSSSSSWSLDIPLWDHGSRGNSTVAATTSVAGALGPQTRLHATTEYDTQHRYLATFLLRHVKKLLLFCSLPLNPDAIMALHQMIATSHSFRAQQQQQQQQQQQHQQQHLKNTTVGTPKDICEDDANFAKSTIGSDVTLSPQDVERLNFILHRRHGGYSDDGPLSMNSVLFSFSEDQEDSMATADTPIASGGGSMGGNIWNTSTTTNRSTLALSLAYRLTKRIPLSQLETHLRRHLTLLEQNVDDDAMSTVDSSTEGAITSAMATLSLASVNPNVSTSPFSSATVGTQQQQQQQQQEQPKLYKELLYSGVRGTTILMKPRKHHTWTNPNSTSSSSSSGTEQDIQLYAGQEAPLRLHDVTIVNCSDTHMYLLQPFEHVMIQACTDCTIVLGSVAGLLHVQDCERLHITCAARRICVSNSLEVILYCFTPSPPFLVGNNRSCQFAPYNTYYDGLREDLLATGLAATVVRSEPILSTDSMVVQQSSTTSSATSAPLKYAALTCASNKWKIQVELSKLEVPSVTLPTLSSNTSHSLGEGERATDDAMTTPIVLPSSEFHMLFIPLESEAMRMRRLQAEVLAATASTTSGVLQQDASLDEERSEAGESITVDGTTTTTSPKGGEESPYCRNLSDMLHSSPFRLPVEYERRVHLCAERVKSLHAALRGDDLTIDQQANIEEELNQKFRDWLVTSGNLRQVLDLVHMESDRGM
jgi:TBCC domain-containing protein 1